MISDSLVIVAIRLTLMLRVIPPIRVIRVEKVIRAITVSSSVCVERVLRLMCVTI